MTTRHLVPADALLAILRDEGVQRVFGNPGTSELPFLDSLVDAEDIEFVLGVHEGPLMAMADGYARATGRPAFVSLHIAAGLANGLIGLLNASRSSTPLVVMAGQQDRRHLVQDPMLSWDLVGLARPAVKHAFDVRRAEELPVLLRRAFALAATPPCGPVFLSVPMDVLAENVPVPVPGRSTVAPLGPATDLARAADLLATAARPAIVAGDGVGREEAVAELAAVAEALGATVYHQPMNDGIDFPTAHPLYAGMLDPSNAAIRDRLGGHDVVFVVGCHAFMPHHYTPGPAMPDGITVIQADSDPTELGRNFAVDAGLVGGIRPTLAALAGLLVGRVLDATDRIAMAAARAEERVAALDARALAGYRRAPVDPLGLMHAGYRPAPLPTLVAVHALVAGLREDTVVVEEAITAGLVLRELLRLDRPRSYVHTVGGGLGSGIGAAIGSRLGDPSRPVVAVLGDGCAMFGLQGLWTAAHHSVPVTFVVMNNGEYRTLKNTLDRWSSRATATGRYPGLDLAPPALDFTRAADFFGIDAVRVVDAPHLTETVAKSTAGTAPLLVDVPIVGHDAEKQGWR